MLEISLPQQSQETRSTAATTMVRRCVSCTLPAVVVLLACHTGASRRTLQATSTPQFTANGTSMEETANKTILDILGDDASLKDLILAFNLSGLLDSLSDPAAEFTLFAPVNFSVSSNYWVWKAHLRNILNFHILPGLWTRSDLIERRDLQMESGEETEVQVIDNTTITTIIRSPGSMIQHEILKADSVAANGIVHKISSTMHPFWYDLPLLQVALLSAQNIPFRIALDLLTRTDAAFTTLPLTVFAPIDAAFFALGDDALTYFRDPANIKELTDFTEGHLVNGIYSTDNLTDGQVLQTRGSNEVVVSVTNNTVRIQDAAIIDAVFLANNGIVYSLDRVILSPAQQPIVQQPVQPATLPPSAILPPEAPSSTQNNTVAPASAPLTLVFRSVTLQLKFLFVVDRLSEDKIQAFEEETKMFYENYFNKVEGQRLGVQNVTTTIHVRNQTVDESSITLTYNQTFAYILLGNPLLDNEQYVTTPFLDAAGNALYWTNLLSWIPGVLHPIMVPVILDKPTESGDGRSMGVIIGPILGGVVLLSAIIIVLVSRRKNDEQLIPVDAVPAAEMVVNSDSPLINTRPGAIVEVLHVDPISTQSGSEIKDVEADGPRFKDQCRLVGARKSEGESSEAQLSDDGPEYKDQVRSQTSGHSKSEDHKDDDESERSQPGQIRLNSDYTASIEPQLQQQQPESEPTLSLVSQGRDGISEPAELADEQSGQNS